MSEFLDGRKRKWIPLSLRPDAKDFLRERDRRIEEKNQRFHSSPEGKIEVEELDDLGKMISHVIGQTGLNWPEFCEEAGVNERKLLFATTGLLEQKELLEEGFLYKIDVAFKKILVKKKL